MEMKDEKLIKKAVETDNWMVRTDNNGESHNGFKWKHFQMN